MNESKNILARTAQLLDLPGDVMAGLPRVELVGTGSCTVEPHRGLLEYDPCRITIATSVGVVEIAGAELTISAMNRVRLSVQGQIASVIWKDRSHG